MRVLIIMNKNNLIRNRSIDTESGQSRQMSDFWKTASWLKAVEVEGW